MTDEARRPMPPMLEQAISLGIITEAQARDADAFADGLASRTIAGELTIEQARAQASAAAQRDGEADRRSRARRGLAPISLLAVFVALAAGEDAPEPEPEPAPPEPDLHPFALLYPIAPEGVPECGKTAEGYAPCRRPAGHASPCWHPRVPEDVPELAPGEVLYTVPYDPEALGAHVRGQVVRTLIRTAEIAREHGWTAATLRLRPSWHEPTLRAGLVRQAVKWGLIT